MRARCWCCRPPSSWFTRRPGTSSRHPQGCRRSALCRGRGLPGRRGRARRRTVTRCRRRSRRRPALIGPLRFLGGQLVVERFTVGLFGDGRPRPSRPAGRRPRRRRRCRRRRRLAPPSDAGCRLCRPCRWASRRIPGQRFPRLTGCPLVRVLNAATDQLTRRRRRTSPRPQGCRRSARVRGRAIQDPCGRFRRC